MWSLHPVLTQKQMKNEEFQAEAQLSVSAAGWRDSQHEVWCHPLWAGGGDAVSRQEVAAQLSTVNAVSVHSSESTATRQDFR